MLVCGAPIAAASSAAVRKEQVAAAPGQRVSIGVKLAGVRSCTLTADRLRASIQARGASRAAFSFRVHRRAKPGPHVVALRCSPVARRRVTVEVRRGATNRRGAVAALVAGAVHSRVTWSPTHTPAAGQAPVSTGDWIAPPLPALPPVSQTSAPVSPGHAAQLAAAWWAAVAPHIALAWHNGQCTDWAHRKRPDIVQRVETARYAQALAAGTPFSWADWTARAWDDNARAAGLAVSAAPHAGDVAVQEPGVDGAGPATGHVAYVEQVSPDGSFRVSEMNAAGGVGVVTVRDVARVTAGYSFIR